MSFEKKLKQMKDNFAKAKEDYNDPFATEIPAGIYNFKMSRFEMGETSNGTLAVFREQVVTEGEHKGEKLFDMFAIESEFGMKRLLGFLDQVGIDVDELGVEDIEETCKVVAEEEPEYKAKVKYSKQGFTNIKVMEVFGTEDAPEDAGEDAPDYSEMDIDELKDECKERGIEIPKKAKMKDLIALLEENDAAEEDPEEAPEDTAEEMDYTEMEFEDLEAECKERGIKIPKKAKKRDLVKLLEENDTEDTGEDAPEDTKADDLTERLIEFATVRGIKVKDDDSKEKVIKVLKEYEYTADEMDEEEIALFKEAGIDNLIEGLKKPAASKRQR